MRRKTNGFKNCWEYWDCPKEKLKKCTVYKSKSGEYCWFANSLVPRADRGFKSCNDCGWQYEKLGKLQNDNRFKDYY